MKNSKYPDVSFDRNKLTKEDILNIKRDKFNNADIRLDTVFDSDAINHISNEDLDMCVSNIMDKITRRFIDDLDMCFICEMAIAYLEEHKKG